MNIWKRKHLRWDGLVYEKGHVSPHQELEFCGGNCNEGTYGIVHRGKYHIFYCDEPEEIIDVAIKEVKFHRGEAHDELRNLLELRDEEEIIHILNYKEEKKRSFLVTELCAGGDLIDYTMERGKLTEKETREVIFWLLRAIQKCHKHRICHVDIKLDNIGLLYKKDLGHLKLLDFGSSKRLNGSSFTKDQLSGSPHYMAPELCKKKNIFKEEEVFPIDLWCAGIVMFCLLMGRYPEGPDDNSFKNLNFSSGCCDLLARLLDTDAGARIGVEDALNHSFFVPK